MQIIDVLRHAQNGAALANLGRAYGLDAKQAEAIVTQIIPELSAGLERNTLSRGGLADLVQALGQGHHEVYVDDPRAAGHPQAVADGNAILDHVVGSKDKSRAIADHAASATGIPAAVIKAMLPVIAGMMMGGLSKSMKGGLGEIMGRIGGQPAAGGMQIPRPAGGRGISLPQRQPTGGGANDVLFPQRGGQRGGWDAGSGANDSGVRTNSDGGLEMPEATTRPGGMGGPSMSPGGGYGQRNPNANSNPLPMPGQHIPGLPGNADNPYGDLADILRRGLGLPGGGRPVTIPAPGSGGGFPWPGNSQTGGQSGGPLPMPGGQGGGVPRGEIELPGGKVGGGMLWNIVRSILGGAMGFQSKGIIGWLIRMVFMRYGWTILRTILGRGLFGR